MVSVCGYVLQFVMEKTTIYPRRFCTAQYRTEIDRAIPPSHRAIRRGNYVLLARALSGLCHVAPDHRKLGRLSQGISHGAILPSQLGVLSITDKFCGKGNYLSVETMLLALHHIQQTAWVAFFNSRDLSIVTVKLDMSCPYRVLVLRGSTG